MLDRLLTNVFGIGILGLIILFSLGELYWLFMAVKIGSFWMFVAGFFPPTMVVAGLTGGYGLIFGLPQWVYNVFG